MSKGSFLVFFVVSRQQELCFLSFRRVECQNCHMASREFLKILSSARLGDVSAQQNLALAYLTGAYKTPIQPSNALIWLEKSYFSITNQAVIDLSSSNEQISRLLSHITQIPLAETLNSPAFGFGWDAFWKLSQSRDVDAQIAAKWQLSNLLLNPIYAEMQTQISDWLLQRALSIPIEGLVSADFHSLQKFATQCLKEVAASDTQYSNAAKELLIRLQPKDETLSLLWNTWLEEKNLDTLTQAAELGLTVAKLTLGLQLADGNSTSTKSNASLKKAAHWLELAAKDGDRDAWYALGEIYRRPQFSGYSAVESDHCFDRAADLGHPQAQFRKGANLWRKREKIEESVRGLQASYWVWQAHQQGVPEAKELISKILESRPNSKENDWHDLATLADKALSHHAEYKLDLEWMLMCHRIIVANQFHLSKAELLLSEIGQLQREHCVAVDIRWELPKILPRLIQIESISQRRSLLAAGKAFAGVESDTEGNLRQRRYRFDRVTNWLTETFAPQMDAETT